MLTRHIIRNDAVEPYWADSSWGLKFIWAAKGDILLDRDITCAALGIEQYPQHTMEWTEWCKWLYRELTYNDYKASTEDFSQIQVAVAHARELQPWVDQRASVVEELPVSSSPIPQKDGFSMVGFSSITTDSGELWTVIQRTDCWDGDRYKLVMLVYRNTCVDAEGKPAEERWGILTQFKDDANPTICDCEIEVHHEHFIFSEYERLTREMRDKRCWAVEKTHQGVMA